MSKMAEEKVLAAPATVDGGMQSSGDLQASSAAAARVRPVETLLRAAPLGLCVAAMAIMLRNSVTNEYGTVSYSDLGGFKYLVYANGLCAAYSLASAFYIAVPRPATLSRSWVVFLLDQVFTYLILAAGAASGELLYLAYNGDKEVTWSEACGVFGGFCRQARTSVAITFASVACYILLSLISSYRLFSAYDPPQPSLGNKGVEIAAFPR
ncbi:CASP-like protein 2A1 [Oryza glaberrima]|uniref:CASP-like protein n=1 Tax=Oryza glaberrima TaxID=4538 RepID=I1PJU6_ORYGL|nr:CASP-like protein 2A1 [Oryza glaberrima]